MSAANQPILIGAGQPHSASGKLRRGPGRMMDWRWRVIAITLMLITLILLMACTMSTGWRMDEENRMGVDSTLGLWRICRDITFGATVDHACLSSLANDAPPWFHCTRAFMLLSLLFNIIAFFIAVNKIAKLPILKHPNEKPPSTPMILPALLMFLTALFALLGLGTFGVASQMREALYFPEKLPPTWANSWAQVWAKLDSLPSERPDVREIILVYGYSFYIGWLGFVTCIISFVINIVART